MSASFSQYDFRPSGILADIPVTSDPASDSGMQRAFGEARIALGLRDGRLHIGDLYQKSPARILMPRIDGAAGAEVVFINTSGGVAGGDVMRYAASASAGARVRVTTQAAERIYRALDSDAALENRLAASGGAALEWLPQSCIVFDGARLARRTQIDVSGGASVLAYDSLVLGRAAHGETMRTGAVRDDWRVRRDGRLVWADAFRLTGDIAARTSALALLGGRRAIGTFLYAADDAAALLERARDLASDARRDVAGALVQVGLVSGLVLARFAAHAAHDLTAAAGRFIADFRVLTGAAGGWPPAMWRC